MLLGLLAMCATTASAQMTLGDEFMDANYIYKVTKVPAGATRGDAEITAVLAGANPVSAEGVLTLPGQVTTSAYGTDYNFNVRGTSNAYAPTGALQYFGTTNGTTTTFGAEFTGKVTATSVVIPKEWTLIRKGTFDGFTNMKSISFEANSLVNSIENGAFATTQINTFDFSNCIRLTSLQNGIFVEAAGAKNSYIKTIKLPAKSTVLKDISTAFMNLTKLTTIENLENSAIQSVVAGAFQNDVCLESLTLPGTVQTIDGSAFVNSGIATLTIDVTSITSIGNGTGANIYGYGTYKDKNGATVNNQSTLKKLVLTGDLGGVVENFAFDGCDKLATLDLSGLTFVSGGQFASNSFRNCVLIEKVSFKAINDTPTFGFTIDANAFVGCTSLATVEIGSINSAQAIGYKAFGENLKTVKIGTIKAGALAIAGGAFVYDNVKGTSLNLAMDDGEYLSSDDASTRILDYQAFDFSNVNKTAATGWNRTDYPNIHIGKIRSVGGVFTAGTITGKNIYELNFDGEIAANGIDACPIELVASLQLDKLNFNGKIGTGGIASGAFANLPKVMTLNFAGELVEDAIAAGAFDLLLAGSKINYTCATITDEYVNPFVQTAFDASTPATFASARDIEIEVTNAVLKSNFQGNFDGSGIAIADGEFDIYRVKFYAAPIIVPVENNFTVYRNDNDKKVAWGRINFFTDAMSSTLPAGTQFNVQRVQTIDGKKTKLTLYATYTDEDDALNASTIYMVPLKVKNGYYNIDGTADDEVIIAKLEKSEDFTIADIKVPVDPTGYVGADESLWPGLTNTTLDIAQNIMTNQQLIDDNAQNAGTPISIYTPYKKDLYIMSNPAKYKGFRIDKTEITAENNAYINTGWYFMLLKHYEGAPAAANVVWMDDSEATGIFGITEKKTVVEDGAIYTLQGVRVSATQKGKIYIMNGKKFIAK